MKQENSQPVKQHKKMNGFADRKLLAGLVFAVLVSFGECRSRYKEAAIHSRNPIL